MSAFPRCEPSPGEVADVEGAGEFQSKSKRPPPPPPEVAAAGAAAGAAADAAAGFGCGGGASSRKASNAPFDEVAVVAAAAAGSPPSKSIAVERAAAGFLVAANAAGADFAGRAAGGAELEGAPSSSTEGSFGSGPSFAQRRDSYCEQLRSAVQPAQVSLHRSHVPWSE